MLKRLFATEIVPKAAEIDRHQRFPRQVVERYFRDAKVTESYEGTNEMQRLGIASALLKE